MFLLFAGRRRWFNHAALSAALVCGIALVVRLAAARGSLWLDEIWSLQVASEIGSPLEILTGIQHDNNHFLNTLYLYVMGVGRTWIVYRLPAVMAGVMAVALAGWIGAGRGRVEQFTAMALTASSYLLIQYSSEARGYGPAVLFALASFVLLKQYLETSRTAFGVGFSVAAALGLLSHPSFVHVYVAALYWTVTQNKTLSQDKTLGIGREEGDRENGVRNHWCDTEPVSGKSSLTLISQPLLRSWALCHALPMAVGFTVYVVNLRHITLGGGPQYSLSDLLTRTGSLALGGPAGGIGAVVISLLFVAGILSGLRQLQHEEAGECGFYVVVLLLPLVQVVVARPPFLFVRYFLMPVLFGLLLCSFVLARWFRQGRRGQWLYVLALALFLIGNGLHTWNLIRVGRGQYLEALAYMASADSSSVITVSSDHNHGTRKLIEFYAPYLKPSRDIVYKDGDRWGNAPPTWLILHQYRSRPQPRPAVYPVDGETYELDRFFDCALLSGWQWSCYRRRSE